MSAIPAGVERAGAAETPFRRFVSDFCESRVAVAALAMLALIIAVALLAPWIAPQDPYDLRQLDLLDSKMPPGSVGGGGMLHLLGTDAQGRDMLSAIMYGLRTSLAVGVGASFGAMFIGLAAGLIAAYFGWLIETVIMRTVDMQLSFPSILVALILVAGLGQGVDKIIIALMAVQWAYYARTVRGTALVERRKEYIEAARCLALGHRRVVFRHLLPNCLPPLIVVNTVLVASAISLEATLSFLGLGLPITKPSLGLLIANGFQFLLSGKYWISFFPGVALLIIIMCINLVGDQLRDVLNPRLQR